MITAAWLSLYSLAIMAAGPAVLGRLTRVGHAPRLGIAVWLTAIGSVLLCWPTAAVLVAIEFGEHTTDTSAVVASCLQAARDILAGGAGLGGQMVAWLLLALGLAVPAVLVARVAHIAHRMTKRAGEHASAVRIVGRSAHFSNEDVVVMQSAQPAAYCVAGHPSAIVVTSAAVDALGHEQLAAVLAHERAHLAGRHAALLGVLRGLASVLPRMRLFTDGAARVSTLLEMRADDVASRRHGPDALLGGLLALSGAAPRTAMAAAGQDVVVRAQRLAGADLVRESRARAQALLGAAMMLTTLGPVSIAAMAITGVLLCTP